MYKRQAQPGAASNPPAEDDLRQEVRNLLAQGVKSKTAAQIIAEKYGMKKNEIYPLTLDK